MKSILVVFITVIILSGCSNKPKEIHKEIIKNPQAYSLYEHDQTQTVQTGRYTLVELDDPTKNYVLDQIIDTSLPKNLSLTVKDGMNYVLNQSGFTLCDSNEVAVLYGKSLPKIQYKIGPVKLSDALQIMAGPAWQLTIDDVEREVCFILNDGYRIKPAVIDVITPTQMTTEQQQLKSYSVPPENIKLPLIEVKKMGTQEIKTQGVVHE